MLLSFHTSNFMSTLLLMFFNNSCCPVAKCIFYSKIKTKTYIYINFIKNLIHKTNKILYKSNKILYKFTFPSFITF